MSLLSATFTSTMVVATPNASAITCGAAGIKTVPRLPVGGGCNRLVIEGSSRPQKKATSHHKKTRLRKTQPWDVRRRGPTVYPPLPSLPPEWTLVTDDDASTAAANTQSAVPTSEKTAVS